MIGIIQNIFFQLQWKEIGNKKQKEILKIHTYVGIKQHTSEEPMIPRRNHKGI